MVATRQQSGEGSGGRKAVEVCPRRRRRKTEAERAVQYQRTVEVRRRSDGWYLPVELPPGSIFVAREAEGALSEEVVRRGDLVLPKEMRETFGTGRSTRLMVERAGDRRWVVLADVPGVDPPMVLVGFYERAARYDGARRLQSGCRRRWLPDEERGGILAATAVYPRAAWAEAVVRLVPPTVTANVGVETVEAAASKLGVDVTTLGATTVEACVDELVLALVVVPPLTQAVDVLTLTVVGRQILRIEEWTVAARLAFIQLLWLLREPARVLTCVDVLAGGWSLDRALDVASRLFVPAEFDACSERQRLGTGP
mmetsp:Transcript_20453/g.65883  ORF Transcript_20453/g.65883 Transcript_20453/m.65883 type:complete len:312 (-) Transcript_20453:122-1057(-)